MIVVDDEYGRLRPDVATVGVTAVRVYTDDRVLMAAGKDLAAATQNARLVEAGDIAGYRRNQNRDLNEW